MRRALGRSPLAVAAALGAALTCGSCSLTGVTDFTLPNCADDSDCQAVNEALQERGEIPAGCRPWVCRQDRCVDLREISEEQDGDRDLERCDGFDNDCDQRVDEAYSEGGGSVAPLSPAGSRLVSGVTGAGRVSYGVSEAGRGGVAWTNEGMPPSRPQQARYALFGEAAQQLTYQSHTDEAHDNLRNLNLTSMPTMEEHCWRRTDTGTRLARCNFADFAFDIVDGRAIAATITATGCVAGQIRAGFIDFGGGPYVVMRGPGRRSSTYAGIDPTPDGKCMGASRPACADAVALKQLVDEPCSDVADCGGDATAVDCVDSTCTEVDMEVTDRVRDECGASSPSVAALEGLAADREPQALAAWVADAFSREEGTPVLRGECGGDEVPVEVIGLYLDDAKFGEEFRWVTGTGEGVPQSLGTTTGGGEPGVTAVADSGYLVGHASPDGSVALHFVGPAPDLPAYDGTSCCMDPDMCTTPSPTPSVMCVDEQDRAGVMTDPLETIEVGSFGAAGGGLPDDIDIATSRVDNERVHVGIAWREGDSCSPSDTYAPPFRIGFRQLVLRVTGGGVEVEEMGDAVTLASASRHFGAPSIVHVPSGLVTEGFTPMGGEAAGPEETGGWWVAWSQAPSAAEPGRVVGVRVAQVGSVLLDDEPIELTQDLGTAANAVEAGLSLDEDGNPRFAYYDRRNEAVVGGSLSCRVEMEGGEEE